MALVLANRKRKRYSASATVLSQYRPHAVSLYRPLTRRRRAGFIPGVDRTGGFYGRYSGRHGEMKFLDVDLDDAVVAAGGVITPTINIIPQNNTESGRIGRKCTLKSIYWSGDITLPEVSGAGSPGPFDNLRIILYQDKQCNGATSTALGILETVTVHAFRNLANSGRFQILMDRLIVMNYLTMGLNSADGVDHAAVKKNFAFYKKCNIPLEFDNSATTGVLTTIRSNNVGVLLVCENGIVGFSSKFRLRFSDENS